MKQFLIGFIITIIIGLLIWFLLPKIDMPDTSARETELVGIVDSLRLHIATLEKERDSLKQIPPLIDIQIVEREREINESIAKDSSNSLVEYRRSLQDNNYLPDGTLYLTYREVGLGAILMAKVPKLKLKVTAYEEIVFKDDIIISDLKYQIGGYIELNQMQKESTKYYKELYDKESAWYHEDWIWYGLGILTAGGIMVATGMIQ